MMQNFWEKEKQSFCKSCLVKFDFVLPSLPFQKVFKLKEKDEIIWTRVVSFRKQNYDVSEKRADIYWWLLYRKQPCVLNMMWKGACKFQIHQLKPGIGAKSDRSCKKKVTYTQRWKRAIASNHRQVICQKAFLKVVTFYCVKK